MFNRISFSFIQKMFIFKSIKYKNYFLVLFKTKIFFFKIIVNKNIIFWNINIFEKYFFKTILYCYFVFFKILSCLGKSFRLLFQKQKRQNKCNWLNLIVNKSHKAWIYGKYLKIKFLSKTRLMIFFFNFTTIKQFRNLINNLRGVNIFTSRGFKFSPGLSFKKKGKISTYSNSTSIMSTM